MFRSDCISTPQSALCRPSLEHTLGVDLIYCNQSYEMFVLVQYKIMRDEGGGFRYRPDSQLNREMALMSEFSKKNKPTEGLSDHKFFRLNDDVFLVKLVPQKGLTPAAGELVGGMYLLREYMDFLLSPGGPRGPRDGVSIDYSNSPR